MNVSQERILKEVHFSSEAFETPVQWGENNRVMTSEVSVFRGPLSYDRTPWAREMVNNLLPYIDAHKIAIMKAAQLGVSTVVIETGIGWAIKHAPCPMLLASADADLLKEQFEVKIDNMIDNSGLRPLIRSNANKKRNDRSGDTNKSKEFMGGRLYGRSVQTAGKWKQTAFKNIFVDDMEAARRADKREGSIVKLINQRAASFGNKSKIFYISTPADKINSNIEPLYEQGDQRKYMVPCPCCGDHIPLEFQLKLEGQIYGIVWETDDEGLLVEGSVSYRCQSCGDTFKEEGNKAEMLRAGFWLPTSKPSEPGFRSYHINALYAAVGMLNWSDYARDFVNITRTNDTEALKTFFNLVLAKTWEEKAVSPSATAISGNTREYPVGLVPSAQSKEDGNGDIILLTCACDLNGFDAGFNKEYDDARLDYEILAHSENGATYSIDQGSIGTFQRGKKPDGREKEMMSYKHGLPNCVWPIFRDIITKEYQTDEGKSVKIAIAGVDVGAFSLHAWQFINSMAGHIHTVGLKGDTEGQMTRLNVDKASFSRSTKIDGLYMAYTNQVKNKLSDYMKLVWSESLEQPPNFMNFPTPESSKYTVRGYFSQFESEEKNVDVNASGVDISYRWGKKSNSSRNHFWDCRVYNLVLRDIIAHAILNEAGIKIHSWSLFCKLVKNG